MSRTVVVIPRYNEAQRLDVDVLCSFAACSQGIRFLMVNDGSGDDTLSLLESLSARDREHFDVYDLPQNVGKAEAVRREVLKAATQRPDYIAFWDADLATPLEAIEDFRRVLEEHVRIHVVIGTRIPTSGAVVRRCRSAAISSVPSHGKRSEPRHEQHRPSSPACPATLVVPARNRGCHFRGAGNLLPATDLAAGMRRGVPLGQRRL
jgi:glycosyltransferase involved in cell wall biosynthesis